MDQPLPDLSRRIDQVLRLDPDAAAVEHLEEWSTWGDLDATAGSVAGLVAPGLRVGALLRNDPASVATLVGLLRAGACVVVLNPGRGEARLQDEVASLDLPVLAGGAAALEAAGPRGAEPRLVVGDLGDRTTLVGEPPSAVPGTADVAVEMLTSGTTGPPKRVPLTYQNLWRVLAGAKHYERGRSDAVRLRSGVAVVTAPLVHLSGLFRVVQCVADGRPVCLLGQFRVDEWVEAVRRHRPLTASLVPAALRAVLEADVDPASLVSLRSVVSGTAPLDPDDADLFTERFGVPVLVSYAATEFGGGVAGWNLPDHERWWAEKRGSVGRPHPGCDLRVVDPSSGAELPFDVDGLLEVRTAQMGDSVGWVRTTDLARIDRDGFVWILGRADQAIIRGGFKVRPEEVRAVLERDPHVRGAAVVGRSDARLGEVPVAVVEVRPDMPRPSPDQLLAAAAERLAPYELPMEIRIVDELPRTPSGKPDLAAVRELLGPGLEVAS